MIKIAFVINTLYGPTGGTEGQLLQLIKNLDRTKFSPVLCVMHTSEWLEEEFDLCPLYIIGINSYWHVHTLQRFICFIKFIKTENVKILQTLFQDGMRVGILAGKLAKVHTIIASKRNQGYWMTPLDCKIFRLLNRCVTLFIANSYNTKKWASEFEGIPEEKIRVIHNGVDLDDFVQVFDDTRESIRKELSISESARIIGIVANLRPVKSIDIFLRAAQIVKQKIPDTHFIIVGHDELDGSLKLLSEKLKIADNTHFLGRRTDVYRILKDIDIGVLSSKSESFSTSIVEYLASGLPVVCTDVGGVREAVFDNVNGFVVGVGDYRSMADRIIKVIVDDLIDEMGRESKKIANSNFSLSMMIDEHQKIYQSCGHTL